MKAYHFTADTLRDGRPIPLVGEWLEHEGELVPCKSGLHASEHPFDALSYAPGKWLHLVELDGEIVPHGDPVDKVCARRRKIVATINADDLLWRFASWCALQVIDKWEAPEAVKQYLTTGDESLKGAARAAALAAASAAARAAARDAAWDAARDAAWAAAWDAARAAYKAKFAEMVEEEFAKQAK